MFACLDDKHKVKVGDPGFPLAVAECGRQVLIHASTNIYRLVTMIFLCFQ